jgi:hypothetical protein
MALELCLPTVEPELVTGLRIDTDDGVEFYNITHSVSHPSLLTVELIGVNDVALYSTQGQPIPAGHGIMYCLEAEAPEGFTLTKAHIQFEYTTNLGAERRVIQELSFNKALSPIGEGIVAEYNSPGWTALVHPESPGEALPDYAQRVGQLFIKTGEVEPGLYSAVDLTGSWKQL